MSIKKVSKNQPENFKFSEVHLTEAKEQIKKYPKGKQASAVMSLLYIVQKQNNNWIPLAAVKYIATLLEMPYIKVYEVVTFYSMFNLSPVGKYFVQVCTTTPCMIRGAKKITNVCKKLISDKEKVLSENNICSWTEVECLGSCVSAPMMQINQDYYEDLDEKKTEEIIKNILDDKLPPSGSFRNRKNTSPENGRTTLLEVKNAQR
jgi:NADH-quinone oxidoreductase E subunit